MPSSACECVPSTASVCDAAIRLQRCTAAAAGRRSGADTDGKAAQSVAEALADPTLDAGLPIGAPGPNAARRTARALAQTPQRPCASAPLTSSPRCLAVCTLSGELVLDELVLKLL